MDKFLALQNNYVKKITNGLIKICEIINVCSTYDVKVAFGEGDFTKVKDIETMHGNICKTFPNGIDILINNAG